MERKISSSFTEFYKIYGVVSLILVGLIWGTFIFDLISPAYILFLGLILLINLINAVNFWRMKDVEMTNAGLIITERFFFKQKTLFVPYEKIERVKNKFSLFGNKGISVKFTETNEFGNEIFFLSNAFTKAKQFEMVEELNKIIWLNKDAESLKPESQVLKLT